MSTKIREFLSIGQVVEQLKPSFPDISISKVRFLEKEQIITLQRSKGGYRKFNTNDVARLKHALELQKDEYLPLAVIKDRLSGWDPHSSLETGGGEAPALDAQLAFITKKDAAARYRIDITELDELEKYGLLRSAHNNGATGFDESAQRLLPVFAELMKYGVHGRHLKFFKANADKQFGLIAQIFAPIDRKNGDKAKRSAILNQLKDLTTKLSLELLDGALKEL